MVRSVGRVALAAVALWLTVAIAGIAVAQDRRQNQPGQFDFYVLSLSWSPSFCEAAGERGTRRRSSNAARGPIPSSCTGCGRNTSGASRNSASSQRRGSTATSSLSLIHI